MDGTPDVDSLVDMTTLDSDLKGDPTAEQFNPLNLSHTATPTLLSNLSMRTPYPVSTVSSTDLDLHHLKPWTTNKYY